MRADETAVARAGALAAGLGAGLGLRGRPSPGIPLPVHCRPVTSGAATPCLQPQAGTRWQISIASSLSEHVYNHYWHTSRLPWPGAGSLAAAGRETGRQLQALGALRDAHEDHQHAPE